MAPPSSRIFTPYRALGYVSNHVPLLARFIKKRGRNLIVTVMGKSFLVFESQKLRLVNISPPQEHDIEYMTADPHQVFTADKNVIKSWMRGTELTHTYVGHEKPVHLLLVFGPHLISIDEDSVLKVWEIRTEESYMELSFDNRTFQVTAVVHPATYINKILLGCKQGALQLWNLKSALLIHTFRGWGSPVKVLQQAPAVDVLAVGLEDGRIFIHNFKYDETIVKFLQEWGPVTALSFRTDGQPFLASSGTQGHIAIWNLEEKKLHTQMRDAHKCAIAGMIFLPDEPLMITNSSDNSLKLWIFDMSDGGARLFKSREGHSGAPTRIRFYGSNGQNILSAGEDSTLRNFSTANDMLHCNLGQASYNRKKAKKVGVQYDKRKMPPITEFSAETAREKDWDNIAAIHNNVSQVTTWSYGRKTLSNRMIMHQIEKNGEQITISATPTCVSISTCGNFVVVGFVSGDVDMFNIQSGIYRGSYGEKKAHKGMVCGVAIDGLNQVTVTVGVDRLMKFWRFKVKTLIESLELDTIASRIDLHRESGLLGIALDDFSLQLLDMDTKRIVRKFDGHYGRITDFSFSSDGRWLVSAALDCTIRTWDIPAGRLIDCFIVDEICTSVTFSPTSEYLATAHVDRVGVYLWVNRTLYAHVSLRPLPSDYEPQLHQALPSVILDDAHVEAADDDDDMAVDDIEEQFKSPEQISKDMITLSLAPESRWKNLLNLDIIKIRNKPKEPPKVPKSAPFFLPTVAGLQFQFAPPESEQSMGDSRILSDISFSSATDFGRKLQEACTDEDFLEAVGILKACGPSAIEVELTSLAPDGGGSVGLMLDFLKMVDAALRANRDFELTQAYLSLFLKLHGSTIAEDSELRQFVITVLEHQTSAWKRVQSRFNMCECIVSYLKNTVLY